MPAKLNSEHAIFSKARWDPVWPSRKKFYTRSWVPCYCPRPLLLPIYLPGMPLSQILQDRILPNNFDLAWRLLLPGDSSTDSCTFFKPFLKSLSYHEVWSDRPLQNCTVASSLLPNPPHTLISHLETLISYTIDWRTGDWWTDFFLLLFLPNSLWTVWRQEMLTILFIDILKISEFNWEQTRHC